MTQWKPEHVEQGDRFFDYCYFEYPARCDPRGKLRSSSLLWHSFQLLDDPAPMIEVVAAIRRVFGVNRTVWGFKHANGTFGWEFYFYNYEKRDPHLTVSAYLKALQPFVSCPVTINENLPYFMFSADLSPDILSSGRLPGINLYIYGKCASHAARGLSYLLTPDGMSLQNHYAFYKTSEGLRQIIPKITCSTFVDYSQVNLDRVLLKPLADCYTICHANKRFSDCLYFSRIDVRQLLFFMKRFDYPESLTRYVEGNLHDLDHLSFCVGYDYAMTSGQLQVVKSGYYGTF